MSFLFQNLRVYQQAIDFAERVSSRTAGFSRPNWYLADQLNRASLSVALNIAESTGRFTSADKRRFLVMARGSVHECVALLDICDRKKLPCGEPQSELSGQLLAIGKMLAGMISRMNDEDHVREESEPYEVQ
jgi:four helix bundle protein